MPASGGSVPFFLIKLFLTPLLIAGVTLAARRWGPIIGGVLVGLPLTSGPASVFLAMERGAEFASHAAHSTLFGTSAIMVFCLAYARLAARFRWTITVAVSLGLYFMGVAFFGWVSLPPLPLSLALTVGMIVLCLVLVRPVRGAVPRHAAPPWDLPFRIVASTLIVIGVTGLSRALGPQLSGIFSAAPAIVGVMSIFTHEVYGSDAVRQFERGVITGTFGFITFFLITTLAVTRMNLAAAYFLATCASTAVNLGICALSVLYGRKKTGQTGTTAPLGTERQ